MVERIRRRLRASGRRDSGWKERCEDERCEDERCEVSCKTIRSVLFNAQ